MPHPCFPRSAFLWLFHDVGTVVVTLLPSSASAIDCAVSATSSRQISPCGPGPASAWLVSVGWSQAPTLLGARYFCIRSISLSFVRVTVRSLGSSLTHSGLWGAFRSHYSRWPIFIAKCPISENCHSMYFICVLNTCVRREGHCDTCLPILAGAGVRINV